MAVDTGHRSRKASRHERGSRPVKEDQVKMSQHSSCFVEFSLESTLALVCTCTMLHNSPSALELTPSILLITGRKVEWLEEIDVSGGQWGNVTVLVNGCI